MAENQNPGYKWENSEDRSIAVRTLNNDTVEDSSTFTNLASSVKDVAQKTGEVFNKASETIGKAIDSALSARDHVVMVRVNDDCLKRIEALVQSGVFKSRSESAAFLISEGIKNQSELFARIEDKITEIERLRTELRSIVEKGNP